MKKVYKSLLLVVHSFSKKRTGHFSGNVPKMKFEVLIMGKISLEEIKQAFAGLDEKEKIDLLSNLIDSVRLEPDFEAEKKNLEEINKRMQMAEKNPSLWLDGDGVMAELEAELHAKI